MNNCENFVKKGTTICTTKPFAYVLSPKYRTERCDYCLKRGKLFKCSACQYVGYCNKTCQKNSWSIHNKECANLKSISPKVMPDLARLMARVIIKLMNGGEDEVGYYSKNNYRKFKDLLSHYSDIKKDEMKITHFVCLYGVLQDFFSSTSIPDSKELLEIYGKICINSFNICDSVMESIGVGIYLGPSIIDHSCKPNVVAIFEGTTILIRTIEDLPCLDWSKIRISYIDLLKTTKARREILQSSYYFWCDCERCTEPEYMAEAAACPNKLCTYPCSPDAESCKYCSTKFPEGFQDTFKEVSDFTAHHLQRMNNTTFLDVCKVCLRKQKGVLHPFNMQHAQTLQDAFYSAITLQHFEEAESFAQEYVNCCLTYHGTISPFTGVMYLMIGRMQAYLGKPKEALEAYKRAQDILTITHGKEHSLIREKLLPDMCFLQVETR